MEDLIITIIKQGSFAFLASRITKALGQKEISDIIVASGWAMVSIEALDVVLKAVKSVEKFFDKASSILH